jgi:acetyl-CoA carboxylase carboxyltransferase component
VTWQPELDELGQRTVLAQRMGGAERVARQHASGRLTVRERIDRLFDRGTFHEVGAIAGKPEYGADGRLADFTPANCIIGRGHIDGRPAVVAGDDFTVRGGSAEASIQAKIDYADTLARTLRLPLVRLIEGSGGGGSIKKIEETGRTNLPGGLDGRGGLMLCGFTMAEVPVVSMALGSVAGLGAARVVASHFSIMVRGISAMFSAGPPVVERLGEKRTKEELGGADVQIAAGAIDDAAENEDEAFAMARRFLSYLPSSVYQLAERTAPGDDAARREESLLSVIPRDRRKVYKMRNVIGSLFDRDSFFEMSRGFGRSVITGLARLDGWPVAVLAGDPYHYGGAWTAASAQKIVRFVDLAEVFHLPVVHLVDCPGVQIGLAAESSGVIRHAMRAVTAINQTSVPWCSIVVRNAFGVGGGGHCPVNRLSLRYAWPSARWGSMPLEGGIEAAYRAELDAAPDPAAAVKEIEGRLDALRSPLRTAEAFNVEEIIDPRDTRRLLCEFANLAAPLRTPGRTTFAVRP